MEPFRVRQTMSPHGSFTFELLFIYISVELLSKKWRT